MAFLIGDLVAIVLILSNLYLAISLHRKREEAKIYLRHCQALDQLLAQIVMEAFEMKHLPIYQCWAESMGSISVDISAKRLGPEYFQS